ncbi:hypothetical protein, partial [Paenibacillus favisporus]|uniref:hypothetical protein n=1 Tax=Paenibacillus favisporus TaxID=221028 RepID=UPI003D2A47E6
VHGRRPGVCRAPPGAPGASGRSVPWRSGLAGAAASGGCAAWPGSIVSCGLPGWGAVLLGSSGVSASLLGATGIFNCVRGSFIFSQTSVHASSSLLDLPDTGCAAGRYRWDAALSSPPVFTVHIRYSYI